MSWGCYYQCCLGHTACGCNHSGKRLALAQREQRADRRAFALPFAICGHLISMSEICFLLRSRVLLWIGANLPLFTKHCPWLPAPANWCAFASKEVHVASTSPDLCQVALFSEGLSHDRCNCLWQLTGVIYHIGREGRLFEYELYIDCIKMIHMQKGFWNTLKSYSFLQLHSCSSLRACVVHTVAPADRWRLKWQRGREATPLGLCHDPFLTIRRREVWQVNYK